MFRGNQFGLSRPQMAFSTVRKYRTVHETLHYQLVLSSNQTSSSKRGLQVVSAKEREEICWNPVIFDEA